MTLTSPSTTIPDELAVATARALRKLYFIRAGFSITWVTLVALFANSNTVMAMALLIIYPAWDVIGTFMDIKANRYQSSLLPQYVNAVISALTTIAVGLALLKGIPESLIVYI